MKSTIAEIKDPLGGLSSTRIEMTEKRVSTWEGINYTICAKEK